MPCEIGENIYKLRKKNKQLLDVLEANSALLENKIKMLRHTTRSPGKADDLKMYMPSSPLKRRYESSKLRSGSRQITLRKPDTFEPHCSLDAALRDKTNDPGKERVQDIKKTPAKRVRRICNATSKFEVKKSLEMQTKGKNIISKNIFKSSPNCQCNGTIEKHSHQIQKRKGSTGKNSKTSNSKHLKGPVRIHQCCSDKIKFSNKTENQDVDVSYTCSKCLDEARHLLNYSPESVFLRRMKQRLLNSVNEPIDIHHSKMNKIYNCETFTCSSESENEHSHPVTTDPIISDAVKNSDDNQEQPNNNRTLRNSPKIEIQCCCKNKKIEHKDAQLQTSEHLIDYSNGGVPQVSMPPGKKCSSKAQRRNSVKVEASKSQKNVLKKVTSGKSTSSGTQPKRCLCKKQIGGLCCCEVARPSARRTCSLSYKGDAMHSAQLTSSASDPVASDLKTRESPISKHISSEKSENESEQQTSSVLRPTIQSTGYDVIAALVDNDHKKYTSDPCTHQLEELSYFRQKHWFDCHAHPHGATTSELHADSKEHPNLISSFDDDLMQPTLDPCIRAYRLNQRLFPEVMKESHSAGCCISHRGSCVASRLLPTQRRLVTLPSAHHQYAKETSETMKVPPGVHAFPQSNFLICDPPQVAPPSRPHTTSGSPRRLRRSAPSNSLALRFQKGVA